MHTGKKTGQVCAYDPGLKSDLTFLFLAGVDRVFDAFHQTGAIDRKGQL